MNPFQSIREYENYIYTISQQFPSVIRSTLILVPRGKRVATLQGDLQFKFGFRLVIKERLSTDHDTVMIDSYGYELWRYDQKLSWYDSQPHPDVSESAANHPHHKHIPPEIKHHRIPAPEMSFKEPNLPHVIMEIERLIESHEKKEKQ